MPVPMIVVADPPQDEAAAPLGQSRTLASRSLAPDAFWSILARMGEASTAAAVPVTGPYESHLTASDLDRSMASYRNVAGLEPARTVSERHAASFREAPR